jgi:hypothetical protein
MLQTIQEQCLEWARRHGALVAPEKHILVHFTKARTKHNSACPLFLPTTMIHFSSSAHVLGVILNKKLSWQPHLQDIKSKLATQTNVLSRLTASAWGHLPTGYEAALQCCCAPSHHHWLSGMMGPPFYSIFSKWAGGRAPEGQNPLSQNHLR